MWRSRREIRRATRGIHPLVFRAHRMMRDGSFDVAAAMFEQAAGLSEMRGNGRAPSLYIQSGRARLLADQKEAGMKQFIRALSELEAEDRLLDMELTGQQLAFSLRRTGFEQEARQVASWLEEHLHRSGMADTLMSSSPPQPSPEVVLPVTCPSCGAPVNSREIEWADSYTGVCSFCGGLMRGEVR